MKDHEVGILELLCRGMTNREIASALGLTVPTVKWRVNQIFVALAVRNRMQAISWAQQTLALGPPRWLLPAGPMPEPPKKVELAILELLNRGMTNQEIADDLAITLGTVRWYMRGIFGKLQVRNRIEAVARARAHAWLN